MLVFILTACDNGTTHTNDYGTSWEKDETGHWNECNCGAKANFSAHSGNPCIECGYINEIINSGNYSGNIPIKWQGQYTGGPGQTTNLNANSANFNWWPIESHGVGARPPVDITGLSVSPGGDVKFDNLVVGEYAYIVHSSQKRGILVAIDNSLIGGAGYYYLIGMNPNGVHDITGFLEGFGAIFEPAISNIVYLQIGEGDNKWNGNKGTVPSIP